MVKPKIFVLLGIYFILLMLDLGFNIAAIFVPALGAIAETLTEFAIEIGSALIVLFLVFARGK